MHSSKSMSVELLQIQCRPQGSPLSQHTERCVLFKDMSRVSVQTSLQEGKPGGWSAKELVGAGLECRGLHLGERGRGR